MKKTVTFERRINFPTMIGEISAISLEEKLKFVDQMNIVGDLVLSGRYKMTEASRLEEDFSYNIPVEISLIEKIDPTTGTVEISDFNYKIEDSTIVCNIELLVSGLEVIEDVLEDELERECDGDSKEEKVEETPKLVEDNSLEEIVSEDDNNNVSDTIFNWNDDKETYGTFLVYIVRQNESLQNILAKYSTSLEEVEKYNDISNIDIGSKLIIPLLKNEENS